jgi:hypothetical protein
MNTETRLPLMSAHDLGVLGLNEVGYVRAVEEQGQRGFAIHAADGTRIAIMPSRDLAVAAMLQNDLHPVSLH